MNGLDSTPLTFWNVLAYAGITLASMVATGIIFALILQKLFVKEHEQTPLPFLSYLHVIPLFAFYVGVGAIGLTVTLSVLLLLPTSFTLKVWITVLFYLPLGLYMLLRGIYRERSEIKTQITKLTKKERLSQLIAVFSAIFAFFYYISPTVGLYSYPGTDNVSYAFVSKQILKTGSFPFLSFEYPYVNLFPHLYALGVPVLASFYEVLYHTHLAKTYLFFLQFNRGLTPLFVYSFLSLILRKKEAWFRRSCGTVGMLLSTFTLSQYRFFIRGGVGESIGLNMILTLLSLYIIMKSYQEKHGNPNAERSGTWLVKYLFFFFFSTFLIVYVCIYALLLFLSFILGDLFIDWRKKGIGHVKVRVKSLAIVVAFGYLSSTLGPFLLPPGQMRSWLNALVNPLFMKETIVASSHHQSKVDALILARGIPPWQIMIRFFYWTFYWTDGWAAFSLFILGIGAIFTFKEGPIEEGKRLFVGFIILFLLSQNNPFGWYYLPLPIGTTFALVSRIYYHFFIYFAIIEGIGFTSGLRHSIKGFKKVASQVRGLVKEGNYSLSELQKKGVYFLLLLFPLLVANGIATTRGYHTYMIQARSYPAITEEDIEAFQWIEGHIPKNKRFFVHQFDGGKWIYNLLGYTVVPHPQVILKEEHAESIETLSTLLRKGIINNETVSLLQMFKIDYIYIGQRQQAQYDFFPTQFNRTALTTAEHTLTLRKKIEKVMIFEVTVRSS